MFVIDATSMGDPVIESIGNKIRNRRDISCHLFSNKPGRVGFVFDKKSKFDLVTNLELCIKNKSIRFPSPSERGIEELFDELIDFGYDFTESSNIVFNATTGHDDRVMALGLAAWGMKQRRYPRGMLAGFTK
jgi:hypothetical protein